MKYSAYTCLAHIIPSVISDTSLPLCHFQIVNNWPRQRIHEFILHYYASASLATHQNIETIKISALLAYAVTTYLLAFFTPYPSHNDTMIWNKFLFSQTSSDGHSRPYHYINSVWNPIAKLSMKVKTCMEMHSNRKLDNLLNWIKQRLCYCFASYECFLFVLCAVFFRVDILFKYVRVASAWFLVKKCMFFAPS